MQATLQSLHAALTEFGMSAELAGDGARPIRRVATLEEAGPDDISFLSNPKYEKQLATTRAGAVVVKPDAATPAGMNLIRVADPYAAITVLIVRLHGYRRHARPANFRDQPSIADTATIGENATIYPGATIDEHAVIGRNAVVYPGCYVGPRCRVGDEVTLYPNVVIYDDCVVGNRVTIHAGTVIGEDGLGYAPVGGRWVKIPQIGIVEIDDDVEIGANCTIDRATLGRTRIGAGTKFSNLIAIGHGTHVGPHCMFVAQVGIAGSVSVGEHVTMAGQVGVVGHISVGDKATIGAKAGVTNNVPPGETYLGQPAIPIADMKRQVVYLGRLRELFESVRTLERTVAGLEQRLAAGSAGVPETPGGTGR